MLKKEESIKNKEKRKIDKQKLATRLIAGFLAIAMVLSIGATLIFYLVK